MTGEHCQYVFSYADDLKSTLKKLKEKDNVLYERVEKKIKKLIDNPLVGKPLRKALKNRWRVQIGHFVLLYEIQRNEIRFLDFDHHDNIYKKYR